MTINESIEFGRNLGIDIFETREVLKHILNVDNSYLIVNENNELDEEQEKGFLIYLGQLKNGKPLQYITNKQDFMGDTFFVDENVLIPQPDTEILVEKTVEIVNKIRKEKEDDDKIKILDLCTGSGAIAISLCKELLKYLNEPSNKMNFEICATDISKKAIEVAKKNASNILQGSRRIKFIESDMFEGEELENLGKFDIIVSNPPYIKTDVINTLSPEVQNEPHIALDGGKDGLKFYKIIRKSTKKFLAKNGYLLLEIGFDQKEDVCEIFEKAECINDYAGNNRVVIWRNV